jgi:hypothetical protein
LGAAELALAGLTQKFSWGFPLPNTEPKIEIDPGSVEEIGSTRVPNCW